MSACSTSSRATPTAGCWRARASGTSASASRPSSRSSPRAAAARRPASATACWPRPSRPTRRDGPAYTARVMKVFEKRAEAVLGVLRAGRRRHVPHRAGRAAPAGADRRARRSERRRDGRPRRGRAGFVRPLRPAARQGAAGARLADQREGGLDDRHPRARHPAHLPGRRARRGRGGKAGDHGRPRGLSRPAAGHHRSGRRQGP